MRLASPGRHRRAQGGRPWAGKRASMGRLKGRPTGRPRQPRPRQAGRQASRQVQGRVDPDPGLVPQWPTADPSRPRHAQAGPERALGRPRQAQAREGRPGQIQPPK